MSTLSTTLLSFSLLLLPSLAIFCSSNCIDYTGSVCTDQTDNGCILCSTELYSIIPVSSSCLLTSQTTVIAHELNNSAMDTSTYTTSSSAPFVCGNYTFSGEYTAPDFIYKNFTGIAQNHYELVIRYNVAYIGNWTEGDLLRLHLIDDQASVYHDHTYSCGSQENSICGQVNSSNDCVKIQHKVLAHNASYIELNFSSLITETDPAVQSWGIKDLIVAAKMCHARCTTCFASTDSDCLSCASGFYLQGNVCLDVCSSGYFTVSDQSLCSQSCPSGYYADIVTSTCNQCMTGCLVCSGGSICQAWENVSAEEDDVFKDKMEFWILLIVILVLVALFIVYKVVKKVMADGQEKNADIQESMQHSSVEQSTSKKGNTTKDANNLEKGNVKSDGHLMSMTEPTQQNVLVTAVMPTIPGESDLWFNELVDGGAVDFKPKARRRRRFQQQNEGEDDVSVNIDIEDSKTKI